METRATTASPDSTDVAPLDTNGNPIQDQPSSANRVHSLPSEPPRRHRHGPSRGAGQGVGLVDGAGQPPSAPAGRPRR